VKVSAVSYRNGECSPLPVATTETAPAGAAKAGCAAALALAAVGTSDYDTSLSGMCQSNDVLCVRMAIADAAFQAAFSSHSQPLQRFGVYHVFVLQTSFINAYAPWMRGSLQSPGSSHAYLGVCRSGWLVRDGMEGSDDELTAAELQTLTSLVAHIVHARPMELCSTEMKTHNNGKKELSEQPAAVAGMCTGQHEKPDVWSSRVSLPVSAASEVTAIFALIVEDATEVQGWHFEAWDQVWAPLHTCMQCFAWLDLHASNLFS
jgi:hypothetical protein